MANETEIRKYLSQPYSRVLVPDESGRYFAEILELPGCFTEGDTPDEAIRNLDEAMEGWIETALDSDQAIPHPIATAGYSGRVLLRLPKSVHREAARRAEIDGVSLNQYLVTAIAARIGADDLAEKTAAKLATQFRVVRVTQVEEFTTNIPVRALPQPSLSDYEMPIYKVTKEERQNA